jgi:hypothetical protein
MVFPMLLIAFLLAVAAALAVLLTIVVMINGEDRSASEGDPSR